MRFNESHPLFYKSWYQISPNPPDSFNRRLIISRSINMSFTLFFTFSSIDNWFRLFTYVCEFLTLTLSTILYSAVLWLIKKKVTTPFIESYFYVWEKKKFSLVMYIFRQLPTHYSSRIKENNSRIVWSAFVKPEIYTKH